MLKITAEDLFNELKTHSDPIHAKNLQRFFKTGKGDYGEGDVFLGIKVPVQRAIIKKYSSLSLNELQTLLNSKIHEARLSALMILCDKFKKSDDTERDQIFKLYLKNYNNVNNWDLVDISAHRIVGEYLQKRPRKILYDFAKSNNLWKKRIAVISTFAFIRNNELEDTIKLSEVLLCDKHDLIHKATGWVLREVGKKNISVLRKFLDAHLAKMPRMMLRYAIEKMNKTEQQKYLNKKI